MDKWRSKPKTQTSLIAETSLLPPSLRHRNPPTRHSQCKPSGNNNENFNDNDNHSSSSNNNDPKKRRSINGFFKRVSAILEARASSSSSSSSAEDLSAPRLSRTLKGRPESTIDDPLPAEPMGDLLNANMQLLEARLSSANCQSRSSDGSLDGPRRATRRGRVKARVEARRVEQLQGGDSSLDEAGPHCAAAQPQPASKRSRASRTERYLKRMCNGAKSLPAEPPAVSRAHLEDFQHDVTSDNFYARHTLVGVNPLVRQTLQYFSEFDRENPRPVSSAAAGRRPPTPPSRDHTSRARLGEYQRMMGSPEPPARPPPAPARLLAASDARLQRSQPPAPDTLPSAVGQSASLGPRRGSKNLEEALCELEAIYNSLQLGDEELLDRAERRSMEEFVYKGFASSPTNFTFDTGLVDPSATKRKTWIADNTLDDAEMRLRDDMAYRRMHPKERPSSADAQSLSGISYLMSSPIPCRGDTPPFFDPTPSRNTRRREPDVTLDDVVFRNMHHANNTLKVVEPQPPFGIPLGPITAAPDSDYLHANPADSDRARSPYVPCREPDIVTDDLAFRNLRKDAQPGSRQSSPCFLPSTPSLSPLPLPRPASREIGGRTTGYPSANLYGSISKPISPVEPVNSTLDDYCRRAAPRHEQRFARRISDPEAMPDNWQKSSWRDLEVANGHEQHRDCRRRRRRQKQQRQTERYSDVDPSDRSTCAESSDESIRPVSIQRCTVADEENRDEEESGVGGTVSDSLSSVCDVPPTPPPTRSLEPFTEHELSVYKQLCRDLENLVHLTQTGDQRVPDPSASDSDVEKSVSPAVEKSVSRPEQTAAAGSSSSAPAPELSAKVQTASATESSTLKREISSILDSLKCLGDDLQLAEPETARSTTQRDVEWERVVDEDGGLHALNNEQDQSSSRLLEAMETIDGKVEAGGEARRRDCVVEEEEEKKEEEEEEEQKDQVDEKLFLRNVQLAKLSGDWKESTPNSAVATRRTSLMSDDNRHWEGVNKCSHKYNSMPAKTSSLLMFRQYGSKRKSKNRKSICSIS